TNMVSSATSQTSTAAEDGRCKFHVTSAPTCSPPISITRWRWGLTATPTPGVTTNLVSWATAQTPTATPQCRCKPPPESPSPQSEIGRATCRDRGQTATAAAGVTTELVITAKEETPPA